AEELLTRQGQAVTIRDIFIVADEDVIAELMKSDLIVRKEFTEAMSPHLLILMKETRINPAIFEKYYHDDKKEIRAIRNEFERKMFIPLPSGPAILERAYVDCAQFLEKGKDGAILFLPYEDSIPLSIHNLKYRNSGDRSKLLKEANKLLVLKWNKTREDVYLKKIQSRVLHQLDMEALDRENADGRPQNYQNKDTQPIAEHMAPALVALMTDTSIQGDVRRETLSLIHTLFLNAYSRRVLMDEIIRQSGKVIPFFERNLEAYNTEGVAFKILNGLADLPDELYNTAHLMKQDSGRLCKALLTLYQKLGSANGDHLRFYEYIRDMDFTNSFSLETELDGMIEERDNQSSEFARRLGFKDLAEELSHALRAVFLVDYTKRSNYQISPEAMVQMEKKKYVLMHTLYEWLKANRENQGAVLRMYNAALNNKIAMDVFADVLGTVVTINWVPSEKARKLAAQTRSKALEVFTILADVLPQHVRQCLQYTYQDVLQYMESLNEYDVQKARSENKIDSYEFDSQLAFKSASKRLLGRISSYTEVFNEFKYDALNTYEIENHLNKFLGVHNIEVKFILQEANKRMAEEFYRYLNSMILVAHEPFISTLLARLQKLMFEELATAEAKVLKKNLHFDAAFSRVGKTKFLTFKLGLASLW
ncbi:MAG: hypothetical protein AAB893_01590, partial [Patescibacteria group bacterium]